jgi:hypothetical protein
LKGLVHAGTIQSREQVVLFNTGTGLKYAEAFRSKGDAPGREVSAAGSDR